MSKIINPCLCETQYWHRASKNDPFDKEEMRSRMSRAFVRIEYDREKKELSLCGVIGPRSSGNCDGSAGQCVDEIRKGEPNAEEGWTREMLDRLCDIWDEWHLNGMRPYCLHQKKMGWDRKASEEVTIYNYTLNSEALKRERAAKDAAIAALKAGETFTPTPEQVADANRPWRIRTYEPISGPLAEFYKPDRDRPQETKTLGWLHENEHPDGILCRPCPVCGYKYGTSWLREDVPRDVLDFLTSLPPAKHTPAWV